jgi:hypothetical protein
LVKFFNPEEDIMKKLITLALSLIILSENAYSALILMKSISIYGETTKKGLADMKKEIDQQCEIDVNMDNIVLYIERIENGVIIETKKYRPSNYCEKITQENKNPAN